MEKEVKLRIVEFHTEAFLLPGLENPGASFFSYLKQVGKQNTGSLEVSESCNYANFKELPFFPPNWTQGKV